MAVSFAAISHELDSGITIAAACDRRWACGFSGDISRHSPPLQGDKTETGVSQHPLDTGIDVDPLHPHRIATSRGRSPWYEIFRSA